MSESLPDRSALERRRAEKFDRDVNQAMLALGGGRIRFVTADDAYAERVFSEAQRRLERHTYTAKEVRRMMLPWHARLDLWVRRQFRKLSR